LSVPRVLARGADHRGMNPVRLAILGSTGSIGQQTLEVVRSLARRFRVVGLAAGRNVTLLEEQIREFKPELVWSHEGGQHLALKAASGSRTTRWTSMTEMAADPGVDLVMVGTGGKAGLEPTLAALRASKIVALANKEVLVMAGSAVVQAAAEGGGELRPVDSEHSAIWQCLWGEDCRGIQRIILTGSGGAFRDRPLEDLAKVTPREALRHPTWQMGRKITVDSATLMNKGFEAMEARWLFDVPFERIEVLMHRESIIHSLVEFADGSVKAQMGPPDMRLPIRCALCYPERVPLSTPSRLDLAMLGTLHFAPPDFRRYPCLRLALETGRRGGTYPAVLAAADEVAVDHFLAGRIGFLDIPSVLEDALSAHRSAADASLEAVLAADAWTRERAEEWVKARV
jgi:1-deoxy-D-xylulose-5-phosphate reductoisomerase